MLNNIIIISNSIKNWYYVFIVKMIKFFNFFYYVKSAFNYDGIISSKQLIKRAFNYPGFINKIALIGGQKIICFC